MEQREEGKGQLKGLQHVDPLVKTVEIFICMQASIPSERVAGGLVTSAGIAVSRTGEDGHKDRGHHGHCARQQHPLPAAKQAR